MDTTISGGVPPRDVKLWDEVGHEHDVMSMRLLGFWLYMLGDSLIFAALFAAYGVLSYDMSYAGGPTARDVAEPLFGYAETVVLFTSVLAYGMCMVELKNDQPKLLMYWLVAALVLGTLFLGMEGYELYGLRAEGAVPQRSGYLSIFWTVIIVHGAHIGVGLIWMIVMLVQVARAGFTLLVTYRLANLKIFWLFKGLVWTFVYTFVYLRGSI